MGSIVWTVGLVAPAVYFRNNNKMGGETEVETPVVDNKIEDTVKTDKEIIADEEKADKPEKETEEKESNEEGEKKEPKKAEQKPKNPTNPIHPSPGVEAGVMAQTPRNRL